MDNNGRKRGSVKWEERERRLVMWCRMGEDARRVSYKQVHDIRS